MGAFQHGGALSAEKKENGKAFAKRKIANRLGNLASFLRSYS